MRLKILLLCLIIGGCGIKTKNKSKDFSDFNYNNKQQYTKKSFKAHELNLFDFNTLVYLIMLILSITILIIHLMLVLKLEE